MRTSESVVKISEAMVKASKAIKHAVKDKENSHFRNEYATLSSVIDASKEALLDNGIAVIQCANNTTLTTRLQHTSGEFIESELTLILTKNDMQGLGSAITYARRYCLASMLNISQEDDDGNLASSKGAAPKKAVPVVKKPVDKKDGFDF